MAALLLSPTLALRGVGTRDEPRRKHPRAPSVRPPTGPGIYRPTLPRPAALRSDAAVYWLFGAVIHGAVRPAWPGRPSRRDVGFRRCRVGRVRCWRRPGGDPALTFYSRHLWVTLRMPRVVLGVRGGSVPGRSAEVLAHHGDGGYGGSSREGGHVHLRAVVGSFCAGSFSFGCVLDANGFTRAPRATSPLVLTLALPFAVSLGHHLLGWNADDYTSARGSPAPAGLVGFLRAPAVAWLWFGCGRM